MIIIVIIRCKWGVILTVIMLTKVMMKMTLIMTIARRDNY